MNIKKSKAGRIMIRTNLVTDTAARKTVANVGCYSLIDYIKDFSTNPARAEMDYFASQMNVHKRQVIATLNGNNSVILQAGAMQMILGNVSVATNVSGAGDFLKKMIGSKVTGESAVKPRYQGVGQIILEPTYRYILFENLDNWNNNLVVEDGMFLACDGTVQIGVAHRKTLSSAVAGGEGLFNPSFRGSGIVVLESPVPQEELIYFDLENDTLKIDGNMAIAWSDTLDFTVERTTKTLVGSAASGEGLVNVYRGSGRVLVAPVASNSIFNSNNVNLGTITKGK